MYKLHFWWNYLVYLIDWYVFFFLLFVVYYCSVEKCEASSCDNIWAARLCGHVDGTVRWPGQQNRNWRIDQFQSIIYSTSSPRIPNQLCWFDVWFWPGACYWITQPKIEFTSLLWNNSNSDQIENCHRLQVFRFLPVGGICCRWKVLWREQITTMVKNMTILKT